MPFRTKPDMSAVWASLGDNTKPVDSYITNGWEAVRPPRQYFNWLDNRQDSALAYLYQAGIVEWDNLTGYEGGSGVNSYVQGSDGKVYKCLSDNGPAVLGVGAKDPTNQPANAAFWKEAFGTKAAVDANSSAISTLQTQMGDGSGVTNASAWRTALAAVSSAAFTGSNQSLTTDGYQKFPGGLIVQWGEPATSIAQGGTLAVTFPTAFPTGCFQVIAVPLSTSANTNAYSVGTFGKSATGFTATNNSGSSGIVKISWIAVGY